MNKDDYGDFCALFGQAERYIKRLERQNPEDGILIPAVNELRYAGCHIKRSIQAETDKDYQLHITRAERHCKRSICDRISTLIGHINASLYDIKTAYFFVPIASYIENHSTLLAEVGRAILFVDEHTHDEDREAIERQETHEHNDEWPYEQLMQRLDRLQEIKETYDAARPDLMRAARKFSLTIIVPVALALFSASVAIIIALLINAN